MASKSVDEKLFFSQTSIPSQFEECCLGLEHFINFQVKLDRKIVLISSGGTTVPLESRTVRFIDNFSSGTRGSCSAEYFLKSGYAVIFLHRHKSLEPFSRHFNRNIFDSLQITDSGDVTVKDNIKEKIKEVIKQHKKIEEENRLFNLEFTSLGDYLHLLKAACERLGNVGNSVMLYLAAAVSDFYIPKADMSEHKIQSSEGPLELKLQLVPKMLEPLVRDWVPKAFVVSFKLETDVGLLVSKSRQALKKYKHQLVIANILEKRKKEVTLVTLDMEKPLVLSDEDEENGEEIESVIVHDITKLHDSFMKTMT